MKKVCLLLTVLFCITTVSAQKKPVKKSKPKTVLHKIPPPPKVEKADSEIIYLDNVPDISNAPPPMMYESPEVRKFDSERICTNCDTVVLEAGKPHIVVYDVKYMADSQSKTYHEQPTENEFQNSYFGFGELVKREWDELCRNFSENDVMHHQVYRNTFIKIQNSTQETINLLDRQDRHEGYLYWSGKTTNKIFNDKKMVLTTEKISKIRGDGKTSSYYQAFKQDSLMVERKMKTKFANENVLKNINTLLLKEIIDDYALPLQFLNIKNVKSITLNTGSDTKITFTFNTLGQLTDFKGHDNDDIKVNYENNLPISITDEGRPDKNFYFQNNTVTIKNSYDMETYELMGNLFLVKDRFVIDERNYENKDINPKTIYKITSKNNEACEEIIYKESNDVYTTCYSNNFWQLPLTITNKFPKGERIYKFYLNENNQLIAEGSNEYKTERIIYKIENNILKSIQFYQERDNVGKYGDEVLVDYEFYK
ncbi:hypothetical protein [Paenimyroides baculatum]|uniref:Uncharacterized protein n=1 Tax=Paenimyroides baculatum TaxID=2608000 RepID=A0A5M6CRX2_9FLAO|nr:hypothetical protein [Paenimyroides baculatum]KAA5535879.1 hypothetical protein F0460_05425 [Paenimyroides baculatum]